MDVEIEEKEKRLFFGLEVHAPWPSPLPKARMVAEECRHLTLAFLGEASFLKIQKLFPALPKPPFRVGPVGSFDKCLFLPKWSPRVVSWRVSPFGKDDCVADYQKALIDFLLEQGYQLEKRDFLQHITLGRKPFVLQEWKKGFVKLPMYYQSLHLYESLDQLQYKPVWSYPIMPPFEEIEHVGDIAYHVYGESIYQVNLNAQIALAFEFPDLLDFLDPKDNKGSLEEIIIGLNEMVTRVDQEIGSPFKAVSFHGEIQEREDGLLTWEMIVDV
jgi:2'-5' RNA ligase